MATLKTAKNLLQNRDEYARYFTNFRGVDFSSDHTEVSDQRFAYLVNMWRDYKSGEGGAVETIPGYRRVYEAKLGVADENQRINGMHIFNNFRLLHIGEKLINIDVVPQVTCNLYTDPETNITYVNINDPDIKVQFVMRIETGGRVFEDFEIEVHSDGEYIPLKDFTPPAAVRYANVYQGVRSPKMSLFGKSNSLYINGRLYIFDGENIYWWEGDYKIHDLTEKPHIPTTHHLIYPGTTNSDIAPGVEFEQRNILTPKYKNKFIAGTNLSDEEQQAAHYLGNYFYLKYGSDYEEDMSSARAKGLEFPENDRVEVYQYGEKLPFGIKDGGTWGVPEGYPNAIRSITKSGRVILIKEPPKPEENTWDPIKKAFDYTEEEIKDRKPYSEGYGWPFAFSETYDGIEIIAENAITNINGIESKDGVASIITKCTIATVFDNRLFLSGNPEFPTHIFWSGLNGETSYPDPTYFGIVNNDIEGVTGSPVTAMIPVADQLMVLKKENASEGSVIFHTPTIGENNVAPRKYPSTQGLPGRGCLGAACNFLDDPVFISRYGLEAMGSYTNAKYERSIEHRSSLVDAKLLSCDLTRAELTEYEGYLFLLVDGKIFMADSRQTFTHETGVMQYEWYYLEDIGVWEGQEDEFIYAMLPGRIDENFTSDALGGNPLYEATSVRDEFGALQNLIGRVANEDNAEISYDAEDRFYFKNMKLRDEYGRETEYRDCFYVEPTGAKCGGKFIPAERLYVIAGNLYFSAGKYLCKFNFDKRDKETGIIPVEYYNFDERRIFSGCATKMDNCGIPHLTKNTVKRSTVIKTRTYTHSNAKIKVRTNRQSFKQVGRIISGHEVFEGLDFADFTFSPEGNTLFSINEKEKKWVEKQHFIYTDEYCRPFALYYLVYRYNVAGRYKDH